jgi:hypothetical protein
LDADKREDKTSVLLVLSFVLLAGFTFRSLSLSLSLLSIQADQIGSLVDLFALTRLVGRLVCFVCLWVTSESGEVTVGSLCKRPCPDSSPHFLFTSSSPHFQAPLPDC